MKPKQFAGLGCGASLAALALMAGTLAANAADMDPAPDLSGFYGGAEIQLLKPYHSEDPVLGFGHSPAWLGYLGYQSASGLGVRARYWTYDGKSSDPASRYSKFNLSYFDLEATQTFRLGGMRGRVFGGLRLASYKEVQNFGSIKIPSAYGLVTGVEFIRPLAYGFSLFGEARHAYMFDGGIKDIGSPEKNMGYSMTELKLGAEYAHAFMNSGLSFYARAAAIGKYLDGVSQSDSENLALAGAAFTLGLRSDGTNPPDAYDGPSFASGFYSGAEISLVKPHHTEGQFRKYGYDPAYLGFAGYQTASGLGFRARWWHYGEKSANPGLSRYDTLRMSYVDLEATQAFRLGALSGRLSGGLRILKYRETDGSTVLEVPSAYGIVAGVEVSRPLAGGLRLFGEGRHALVFDGKWNKEGTPAKDITISTTGMKAGIEYAHLLGGTGLSIYARAAATAQYWDGMSDADTESTGLWGAAFTLGLRSGGLGAGEPQGAENFASGVYGGTAVSLLGAYHTETQTRGFGLDPAYSTHLGYQSASGLGMRVRGWSYTGKSSDATSRYRKLRMRYLDVEATQAFHLGSMTGRLSGGLKIASYQEYDAGSTNNLHVPSAYGLSAGLELSRPLIGSLSIIGEARHAIMFASKTNDEGSIDHNTTFTISEGSLGLEYAHPIGANGLFYGRVAGTAMRWGDVSDGDSETTSLLGVTFSTGVKFNF